MSTHVREGPFGVRDSTNIEGVEPWDGYEFVDGGPLQLGPDGAKRLRWCPSCYFLFQKHRPAHPHILLHKPEHFGLEGRGARRQG